LEVGEEELLGFSIGHSNLEISARLYGADGELLLGIDHNEWASGNPLPWDIEADWQRLTLRQRFRNINLEIDATKIPMKILGDFWHGEGRCRITRQGIELSTANEAPTQMQIRELALVGLALRIDAQKRSITMAPSAAQGCVISWPNRRERLYKAREAWRRILRGGGPVAAVPAEHI
jgi:hypothetical protein